MDMASLPGCPAECPVCGVPWGESDYGFSPRDRIVDLVCQEGHETRFHLSDSDMEAFVRVSDPGLADKPSRFVGGPLDGQEHRFPEGTPDTKIKTESGHHYRFDRETDEVYVYTYVGFRPE